MKKYKVCQNVDGQWFAGLEEPLNEGDVLKLEVIDGVPSFSINCVEQEIEIKPYASATYPDDSTSAT